MPDLHTSSRPFHTTPTALKGNLSKEKLRPTKSTLLRREMAEWLNGPGYKFRRPFPGSTNYLSAYDKNGNLKRKSDDRAARRPSPRDEEAEEAAVLKQEEEEGITRQSELPEQKAVLLSGYGVLLSPECPGRSHQTCTPTLSTTTSGVNLFFLKR